MQFGSLTVEQWDRQLASPATSPPPSPPLILARPLIALTSNTTLPSTPPTLSAHPSSESIPPPTITPPTITPPTIPTTKRPTTTPAPTIPPRPASTSTSSTSSQPSSRSSSPAAPKALTWAARVASGRSGVSTSAKNLPPPRTISRTPAVPRKPSAVSQASSTSASVSTHSRDGLADGDSSTSPTDVQAVEKRHSPPRRKRPSPAFLPARRLHGLVNGGNGCFINVVLQALLACDAFRQLLHECEHAPAESLVQKFVRLVREMDGVVDDKSKCNPRALKDGALVKEEAIVADWFYDVFPRSSGVGNGTDRSVGNGFAVGNGVSSGGSQEDAEEFLSFVLNGLHEELVARKTGGIGLEENGLGNGGADDGQFQTRDGRIHTMNGSGGAWSGGEDDVWTEMTRSGKSVEIRGGEFAQSGVTDIFGGALRSEVKRAKAKPSVTREPFFSLSLDIESGLIRDVEHALSAYFEAEFLEGYTLEGGDGGKGLAVDAKKQVLLMQMPKVLILHLKRFSHNSVTGALNKVSRNMAFPEVLRVPGKVMHCAGNRWGCDGEKAYELMAVVTHVGKDLACGHYTCDVRWEGEDGERVWFTCDDSKVVRTNMQKVCHDDGDDDGDDDDDGDGDDGVDIDSDGMGDPSTR